MSPRPIDEATYHQVRIEYDALVKELSDRDNEIASNNARLLEMHQEMSKEKEDTRRLKAALSDIKSIADRTLSALKGDGS